MAAITPQTFLCVRVLLLNAFICCISANVATTNVALNKPVFSTDVYYGYTASLANDGSLETWAFRGGKPRCFYSLRVDNPWWAVDLGKPMAVHRVDFTNRQDCCDEWADNFIVGLTNASPGRFRPIVWNYLSMCGQHPGSVAAGATVTVFCQDNLSTRQYVIVQSPNNNTWFSICELQVFAVDMSTRLDDFVVGLTNTSPLRRTPVFKQSYNVCAEHIGIVRANAQVSVVCPSSTEKFRYVIIHGSQTTANAALCLAEVSVFAGSNNLVYNKPASQISTSFDKGPNLAVDGRLHSEACTQYVDGYPWWAVDLLSWYEVGHVVVITGADSIVASHLKDFVVGLTNKDPATSEPCFKCTYTLCGQHSGIPNAHQNITVKCETSGQRFRFVIVQGSNNEAQSICIAEVAVYRKGVLPNQQLRATLGNLALHKTAYQVSTQMVATAYLAVDGIRGSQSCTAEHTPEIHPWWAVDLGNAYDVGHVVVINGRGKTMVDDHGGARPMPLETDAAEQLHLPNTYTYSLLIGIAMLSLCTGLL